MTNEARNLYRQMCRANETNPEAWRTLGKRLRQQGDNEDALTCFERATTLQPDHAPGWLMTGAMQMTLGKPTETEACCRRAVALQPQTADTHAALANALAQMNRFYEASASYRQALRIAPDHPLILFNQGVMLGRQQHFSEAEASYRRAIELKPDLAQAYLNLANLLRKQGRIEEAVVTCRQLLQITPHSAECHYSLGIALHELLGHAEAARSLQTAIRLKPDYAEAHVGLAYIHEAGGDYRKAIACYREALRLQPDYTQAHAGLAYALQASDEFRQAENSCKRAIELDPDCTDARFNLGAIRLAGGDHEGALASFRHVLEIDRHHHKAHSNLLFTLNYSPAHEADEIFSKHVRWGQLHTLPAVSTEKHINTPDKKRRLRVGYVSPDLYQHSVSFFLEPLLAHHDAAAVETFCYADVARPDATTKRLRGLADHWCDCCAMSNPQLVQQIRADGIDLLVDLAGHTAGNRLLCFTARQAPVQLSWLGYPNTTGLPGMDYRLTDARADPPGVADTRHTETLVRLPHGFLCYRPPQDAPTVAPPPSQSRGHVTFGCFNNLAKITPAVTALWADILHAVPDSRLLLKNTSFRDATLRVRCASLFREHAISAQRLELLPPTRSTGEHLALYRRIDVALDTFPYNGTTTTCEALWMGVPVITLAGHAHAGRVGVSLLTQTGLDDLIAENPQEYVRIVVGLAEDPAALSARREDLRGRLQHSALCDAAGFAQEVENAYRWMWKAWCTGQLEKTPGDG